MILAVGLKVLTSNNFNQLSMLIKLVKLCNYIVLGTIISPNSISCNGKVNFKTQRYGHNKENPKAKNPMSGLWQPSTLRIY